MKKVFSIILVIAVCLSLTSCDFNIASIESLMRPPKLSGASNLLQTAFEKSVSDINGVVMKTPISGENRSSYLFFDLEQDGIQEAIVFYSEPLKDTLAYANIFKFVNNEWKCISQINGKGEEVYEVNFSDINGDGVYEILLSWTGIGIVEKTNSSDFGSGNGRVLTIYSCDGITSKILKTESYTNLYFEDLSGDDCDEIVLFKINLSDGEKRTTARILSFNDDYTVKYDDQLTLTGLLEINNIVTDTIEKDNENHTRIFVDGAVSEIGIITEVIDITHKTFDVSLPLYEQNHSNQPQTLRDSRVYSQDIDNDGFVEIPTIEALPYGTRISENTNDRQKLNLTVWSELKEDEVVVDSKCLYNSSYGYMFIMPNKAESNLTATYNENNLTLTFYTVNNDGTYKEELFAVKVFLKPDWEENHYGYTKWNENDLFVYGYIVFDEENKGQHEQFIGMNLNIFN